MTTATLKPQELLADLAQVFAHMAIGISRFSEYMAAGTASPVWTICQSTASTYDLPDWLAGISAEPKEVRRICSTPQSEFWIREVVGMARRHFFGQSMVSVRTEQDSESDTEWVLVDVAVKGNLDAALNGYRALVEERVSKTPAVAREIIHLTFHFI